MSKHPPNNILTTGQVANVLGKNPRTILRYIEAGEFPNHIRLPAGDYLIPRSDLDKYLKKQRAHSKK